MEFRGRSAATRPLTFANNPGWHDDVSDGPVRAQVTFAGHAPIDAEPGYVCVTPPNYAPGLFCLVTMDDVVREVFYDKGWIPRPVKTSFVNDVQPIFQRLTGLQGGSTTGSSSFMVLRSPLDAQNAQVLAKLNDASAANAARRAAVLALFRDPGASGALIEDQIAQVFGDAVDQFFEASAEAFEFAACRDEDPVRAPPSAGLLEHSTPTGRRTSAAGAGLRCPASRGPGQASRAHPCTIVSAAVPSRDGDDMGDADPADVDIGVSAEGPGR